MKAAALVLPYPFIVRKRGSGQCWAIEKRRLNLTATVSVLSLQMNRLRLGLKLLLKAVARGCTANSCV